MKKLKVLVSAYACNPSGDPRLHPGEDLVGWNLVKELARKFDLWIITHAYNRLEIERVPEKQRSQSARFIYVKLPPFLRLLYKVSFGERVYYYLWQIQAWRMAVGLHRRFHFDIAHHLTFGNYWMPSFIGAFLPVPFIWGPIGGGQKIPRAFFKELSLTGKFSEWGRDCAQWVGRTLLLSRRMCMRRATLILVCNHETMAMFPKKFWPKIQFFPVNGISQNELSKSSSVHRSDRRTGLKIITAGRLIRLKAFDIVLKAFAQASEVNPGMRLEIVGQGPEETTLHRLAVDLNLGHRVRFVPWLSRPDLLCHMRASDVFLFSSLRDGGGAVVVEAMASRMPVVCLDTGGPRFHVSGDWGIKVAPAEPALVVQGFAQALLRLAENRSERQTMGKAAYARAQRVYLWENLGARLTTIYRAVDRSPRRLSQ